MHIAMRTMGGFGMYKIKTSWVLDSFRLFDMCQFSRKDTGDRHAVDIKFRNGGQGAWVMNDKGSLYDLTVQEGGVHL
jgi:carbohydrate-binding DOMON domain-containing protein